MVNLVCKVIHIYLFNLCRCWAVCHLGTICFGAVIKCLPIIRIVDHLGFVGNVWRL